LFTYLPTGALRCYQVPRYCSW